MTDALTEPVATRYGKIIGRKIIPGGDRPVNAFQGIPFAKPPIGQLRFKKPQLPNPWSDPLETTKFVAKPIAEDRHPEQNVPVSEDCLYLNLFTPAWPNDDKLFPVMVFIHGGGFFSDSAAKYGDIGISKYLVRECETVMVTLEYRLGFLGFFSTGDDACDDNVALWDMTMGLEWIRDNIRNFRGDPNNVTIFGQSAGGAAVDLLSLSPKSSGLFHRVIPMSGSASCDWSTNPNAVEYCRRFANQRKVQTAISSENTIKELRALDALQFIIKLTEIDTTNGIITCPIAPRIDGDFLPDAVHRLRHSAPGMPRMIGQVQFEGLMMSSSKGTIDLLERYIAAKIPELEFPNFSELRRMALSLYIQPEDYEKKDAVYMAHTKFFNDSFIGIGAQKAVLEQLKTTKEPIYLYSFDYLNPESVADFPMTVRGAIHCIDLNYLLCICMFSKYKFNETDKRVLRIITRLWSNFAKYGNPNGCKDVPTSLPEGDFNWLPATAKHPSRYLSIGPNPTMGEHYQEGRPLFWVELEKHRRKPSHV